MIKLSTLVSFLSDVLGDAGDADPDMANGLQFRGREQVRKIVTGVSASLELQVEVEFIDLPNEI